MPREGYKCIKTHTEIEKRSQVSFIDFFLTYTLHHVFTPFVHIMYTCVHVHVNVTYTQLRYIHVHVHVHVHIIPKGAVMYMYVGGMI